MRRSSLMAALAVSLFAAGCGGSREVVGVDGSPVLNNDLVVIGDFGVGGEHEVELGEAVRAYVRDKGAGMLVTVGDNDYSEGESFSSDWSSAFGWARAEGVSVAGALGNHDLLVESGRYEFDELEMPKAYYRRSFGSVDLFVLDSNRPEDAAQRSWLERALNDSSARWKIGVFHHPAWSCGPHGSRSAMRPLVELMRKHGARLVLTGHDHDYQRFEAAGLTQVVAGWGGAKLYKLKECSADTPAPVASRDDVFGFLVLRVGLRRLEGEAITLDGEVVDTFQVER